MKKGLGSIPKGLAWIDKESFEEQKKPIKQKAEPATLKAKPLSKKVEQQEELNSSKSGLQTGWTRATFIIKEDYNEKIKAFAYWERLAVKDIMDELLANFLKNKKIRSIPKKEERTII